MALVFVLALLLIAVALVALATLAEVSDAAAHTQKSTESKEE